MWTLPTTINLIPNNAFFQCNAQYWDLRKHTRRILIVNDANCAPPLRYSRIWRKLQLGSIYAARYIGYDTNQGRYILDT